MENSVQPKHLSTSKSQELCKNLYKTKRANSSVTSLSFNTIKEINSPIYEPKFIQRKSTDSKVTSPGAQPEERARPAHQQ